MNQPATAAPTESALPGATAQEELAALRAQIDRADDALHDLLIHRAAIVERLAGLRAKGGAPFRPGREADILRRLLARHRGRLGRQAVVRIWREIFAATTALQVAFTVAVCESQPGNGFVQCAREHFGVLTPLHAHRSAAQALGDVGAGSATVAVLPMPTDDEAPGAAWWMALMRIGVPRLHVVGRLPFWGTRPEGAPRVQALVVAAAAPDASGADRSLLGMEIALEVSRAKLAADLTAAGFAPGQITLRRDPGDAQAYALAEVEGFVADGDPRLTKLAAARHPPIVLGAFAIPEAGETA